VQIEQSQRWQTGRSAASTSNLTAPQWQEPRNSISGSEMGTSEG
jgi:hypothetical protein